MRILAQLLKYVSRSGAGIGPNLVDAVGTPGTDDNVPTEKAIRIAIAAGGSGSSPRWKRWLENE